MVTTVTSLLPNPYTPAVKLTRSMTHPLRDPKAGKRRLKQGEPFDPAELSRRLEEHLAQQKLQSERRRAERKAAEAAAQNHEGDHYVPKMAAKSFARTATPDPLRQIHKLSESVLKQHVELSPLNDPVTGLPLTALQRSQAMDQAILKNESLRARNQFQWNRDMEEAAEADADRAINKPIQRTFEEFLHLKGRNRSSRPLSTGDLLSEEEEDILKLKRRRSRPAHDANDHRNDWAQRDEDDVDSRRPMRDRVSPFLPKRDSGWILKGKKDKVKTEKADAAPAPGLFSSPRGSFFARFRRHPN